MVSHSGASHSGPAAGDMSIAEIKEFAGFPAATQRYIRRSLDIGFGRADPIDVWARDEGEAASIRAQGARLAVPGVVDLSDLAAEAKGVAKVVLESTQDMLLKLALQMARDDYEDRRERQRQGVELAKDAGRYTGRKANTKVHERIVALRTAGHSIPETARLAGCSESQVKRVWALHNQAQA